MVIPKPRYAAALSRRRLVVGVTATAAAVGLGTASEGAAADPSPASVAGAVLAAVEAASRELHDAALDGEGWRARIDAALASVDPQALRQALDVDEAALAAGLDARGHFDLRLSPTQLRGTPSTPHFRRKLFVLGPGRAILPHAHRHIVSVFVVLEGRARARHYDRVRDEPDAIVIRPSDDRELGPGDHAAIGDRRDNVHWLTATAAGVVLLNFSATLPDAVRSEVGPAGRVYLDPDGEALAEGLIRAPRAGLAELRAKYDPHSIETS